MNRLFINKEWSPLKKLLFMNAASGGSLSEYTATGNPAVFSTNVSKPLKQLLIPFTPVQAEGTPSPENPLPITGWTEVTISHSGADTSNPDTYSVTFPSEAGTVYGGTLDAVTGVLTVDMASVDLGLYTWAYGAGSGSVWYSTSSYPFKPVASGSIANAYCDKLIVSFYNSFANNTSNDMRIAIDSSGRPRLRYNAFGSGDTESLKAFLSTMTFMAELAEPQTYQLDPTTVQTLIGTNTIWSDTNGQNTVKYLKKG